MIMQYLALLTFYIAVLITQTATDLNFEKSVVLKVKLSGKVAKAQVTGAC